MTSGDYICVIFPGRTRSSQGFVLKTELADRRNALRPPLHEWVGRWRDGDDTISLHRSGSSLVVDGQAYWPEARPSATNPAPHYGEVSGKAAPDANRVVFVGDGPYDCSVSLVLLPPFLVAADNGNCGGANVSFRGIYRRAAPQGR